MNNVDKSKEVLKKAFLEIKKLKAYKAQRQEPLAIVGMGCRIPGAIYSPEDFWEALKTGRDSISSFPNDRWDIEPHFDPDPNVPGKMYTRNGGFLENVEDFDAQYFGISPREAANLDPQHRLLLEVTWEAIEHAGIPTESLNQANAGVFIGISSNDYLQILTEQNNISGDSGYQLTGVTQNLAAGRIAHGLGVRGPTLAVDTACSSSLMAAHLACKTLRDRECDIAIIGGVNSILSPYATISFCQLKAISPKGFCNTFDKDADGYVRSEGCGVLVVKRLSDALRDNDRIHALIKGTATNHDGRGSGLLVPNGAAQQEVMRAALEQCEISPHEIDYLEAHAVGTTLGDTIEINAANSVYQEGRKSSQPLRLGSVKANIGHTEAASGVIGLIKMALCLKNKQIPPHIHLNQANPNMGLDKVNATIPTELENWPKNGHPRRGSLNSFGFSGSNVNFVLEEVTEESEEEHTALNQNPLFVLPVSTKFGHILPERVEQLATFIEKDVAGDQQLHEICATAIYRKDHSKYRTCFAGRNKEELIAQMRSYSEQLRTGLRTVEPKPTELKTVFSFGDDPVEAVRIAQSLLRSNKTFSDALRKNLSFFEAQDSKALIEEIEAGKTQGNAEASDAVTFAIQVAVAQLLRNYGVHPDTVTGEGIGEIAAAYIAEMLTLEDATRIVSKRHDEDDCTVNTQESHIHFLSRRQSALNSSTHLASSYWSQTKVEYQPLSETLLRAENTGHFAHIIIDSHGESHEELSQALCTSAFVSTAFNSEEEATVTFHKNIAGLYDAGADLNWSSLYNEPALPSFIPTTPWKKRRHWAADDMPLIARPTSLQHPAPEDEATPNIRKQVLQAGSEEKKSEILLRFADSIVRKVMRLTPEDELDLHSELTTQGVDSLMAVEIKERIERGLGLSLPTEVLHEHTSLEGLKKYILDNFSNPDIQTVYQPLTPRPEERHLPFPLNDVQQAYWIGRSESLELGGISCHYYIEFERTGLDPERLISSWNELIKRHDMLRSYIQEDGRQVIIDDPGHYDVPNVDLSSLEEAEARRLLDDTRNEMSHQMFDTNQWPLFDLRLHTFANGVTRVHFSFDLLILDVYSFIKLLSDWRAIYQGQTLAPLTLSFRDYLLWENEEKKTESYQESLNYWLERIKTLPPAPQLPLAKNPKSVEKPHFFRRRHIMSKDLWQRLAQRGKEFNLTGSMILCCAYAHILEQWSRSRKLTLNLTLFNRVPAHQEVYDLIGDFTSVVLLEADLESTDTFLERAQQLQTHLREALAHREVTGVTVMSEWSQRLGRQVGAPIVFTSALGLSNAAQAEAESIDEWLGNVLYSLSQTPQVWLDHQVFEKGDELVLVWDSVEELFPEGMLDAMFSGYVELLESLASDDTVWQQKELDFRPKPQREIVTLANSTEFEKPTGLLHDALATQARLTPNAPALVTSRRMWSYDELYRRSNRVANYLRKKGAQPGQPIAILTDKGPEQILACYSVLAAGGIYVPLDPANPPERINAVLRSVEAPFILTQEHLYETYASDEFGEFIVLDEEAFPDESEAPLEASREPEDLAYVIFTSGSTGSPKGVMIEHHAALNTCVDINNKYNVTSKDRIFAISCLAFDLSVYDIFGAALAGACMVIPDDCGMRDPSHWHELLVREKATLWNSVPALMNMYLEYLEHGTLEFAPALRLVMMSGDWIPLDVPKRLHQRNPKLEIYSLGGATEGSIWSIHYPINEIDTAWKSIPYGKALGNQSMHVLDKRGRECPVWVPGEIHIGGDGVATGYWKDEEKTSYSFIQNPLSKQRLYRTGDMGRFLPDGNIEFLGREDFQVKIQGHRIELGEIETKLIEVTDIKSAVVTVWKAPAGELQLVAYLVKTTPSAQVSLEDIQDHVASRLPSHMAPKHYVFLERLPLSENGKVDRKALPEPGQTQQEIAAPRTEMERLIHSAWCDVLGTDNIGIHDSFFDIGGYSQLAVRLAMELREHLGQDIPIRALFESPTIAEIAQIITGEMGDGDKSYAESELYGRYGRRAIGERLAAIGTDKNYVRAQGNTLTYSENGRLTEVLDMVGGFGSLVLGHNHPEIVRLQKTMIAEKAPSHAQYSNNHHAGLLCQELSQRLHSATGKHFISTLASTGTEAVEAALKHAKQEYRSRAKQSDKLSEGLAAMLLTQLDRGEFEVNPAFLEECSSKFGRSFNHVSEIHQELIDHNERVFAKEPTFLALEHAFHGLTSGSLSLSASHDLREPFEWMGVKTLFIAQSGTALMSALETQKHELYSLGFENGELSIKTTDWYTIAALMIEPVQGEGGIRPLDAEFVAGFQAIASGIGFPIIVDEIQSGMGRTGHFTAAEMFDLKGDYYTFSKSLGGGVSKVSAMAVSEQRYQPEFGYLHGSTFAEDIPGCRIALKTLQIIEQDNVLAKCREKGAVFIAKLQELQKRHPSVIAEVRGAGLMIGLEMASMANSKSYLLRAVSRSDPEMFNQLIAGYLLAEKGIRIAPTKTRNTIRLLPSAYVSEEEMDRVVEAFECVCQLIEGVNIGRMLRYLVDSDADTSEPIKDWSAEYLDFVDDEPNGEIQVAHIAHIEDNQSLLIVEPSMREIPEDKWEDLLWRFVRFTRPAIGQRFRIQTKTGESVHVSLIGLMLTGSMFETLLTSDLRGMILDSIDEAVEIAVRSGCKHIGFGGYTSIVTMNCTTVATTRASLTSGNAYTVVLGVDGTLKLARELDINVEAATVGIVGAKGNIGSLSAKLFAEQVHKVILIGRDKHDDRLEQVAIQLVYDAYEQLSSNKPVSGIASRLANTVAMKKALDTEDSVSGCDLYAELCEEIDISEYIELSNDLSQLQECDLALSCTNSADAVIHPEHISDRLRIISDVATPKDVSSAVLERYPDLRILSGGLAQLPQQQGIQIHGTQLPVDHTYGCIAETSLLGLSQHAGHFSFGEISKEQIMTIRELADKYGYGVGIVTA